MLLDILIILIIVGLAIYGFRKGFVFTLIHSVGWVASVVIAYLLTPAASSFVKENTGLYGRLAAIVQAKFDISLDAIDTTTDSIPGCVAPNLDEVTQTSHNVVNSLTDRFTAIFGTVLVFVALFVLVKIVLWLLLRLLSKEYRHGFANFFDGFFGLVFGVLRGAVLVLVLLALLVPLANLLSTGFTEFLNGQLDSSLFAKTLYDENLLLMLIQNYL